MEMDHILTHVDVKPGREKLWGSGLSKPSTDGLPSYHFSLPLNHGASRVPGLVLSGLI